MKIYEITYSFGKKMYTTCANQEEANSICLAKTGCNADYIRRI